MTPINYKKQKNGFVLSLVLWITAAMMLLALLFVRITKEERQIYTKLEHKLQTDLQSESLFELLSFYITTGKFHQTFIENNIKGLPAKLKLDATEYNTTVKNTTCYFSLLDHSALFNLHFLTVPATTETFIQKLSNKNYPFYDLYMDWIDKDDIARLNGAEKNDYILTNYQYSPPNQMSFQHKEELMLLKDFDRFDENTSRHILEYFTVYGSVPINILLLNKKQLQVFLPTLTENEMEHLLLTKESNVDQFFRFFNKHTTIKADNYSTFPSQVITVSIQCKNNDTRSTFQAIVNYRPTNSYSWQVMEIYK